MTMLEIPRVSGPRLRVRCTSKRDLAVVQLVTNDTLSFEGNYRAKVLFRSDRPGAVAQKVRQLGGWSYVFDNVTGELIWQNTSSEWESCRDAIVAHQSRGEG